MFRSRVEWAGHGALLAFGALAGLFLAEGLVRWLPVAKLLFDSDLPVPR